MAAGEITIHMNTMKAGITNDIRNNRSDGRRSGQVKG